LSNPSRRTESPPGSIKLRSNRDAEQILQRQGRKCKTCREKKTAGENEKVGPCADWNIEAKAFPSEGKKERLERPHQKKEKEGGGKILSLKRSESEVQGNLIGGNTGCIRAWKKGACISNH